MKPLQLTMQAFGSYSGPETIDFTELGEHRLFLISGPTGSGKTTVLDGICFGLYGQATGGEREARGFRSDFSSPEQLTYVTLDFAIGDRVFRVERQPEQERAKLRGEGTTTSPVSATLWERTNAADDEEGQVLADKWTSVTKKVEELLGFRSEQFRQVIVLPQGRFRDLLMADSRDREEILKQLFDTRFYQDIQFALKQRAKDIAGGIEKLRTHRTMLLEHSDCESEADLAEMIETLGEELGKEEKRQSKLKKGRAKAQKALAAAEALDELFKKADEAAKSLETLEAQSPEVEKLRLSLERARKAAGLTDISTMLGQRRDEQRTSAAALEQAAEHAGACTKRLAAAEAALERENNKQDERKALEATIAEIQRLRPVMSELATDQSKLQQAKTALASASAEADKAAAEKKRIESKLTTASAEREAQQGDLRDPKALQLELKSAKETLQASRKLREKRSELAGTEEESKRSTETLAKAKQALTEARKKLEALRHLREAASAALLSSELVDGEPCPVCGSEDHPAPAEPADEMPDNEAIDNASAAVEKAEKSLEAAQSAANKAESRRVALQTEVDGLAERITDEAPSEGELAATVTETERAIKDNETRAQSIEAARKKHEELKQSLVKVEQSIEDGHKRKEDAVKALSSAEATVKEKQKQISSKYEGLSDLEDAEKTAKQALERSEKALAAAKEEERAASKADTEAKTAHKEAEARQKKAASELKKAEEDWGKRLEAAGFASEADFQDASLEEGEVESVEKQVTAFDTDLAAAKVRSKDASADISDKKRPDVAADRHGYEELDTEYEKASKSFIGLQEKIKGLKKTEGELKEKAGELAKAEEEYGVAGRLAEGADGKNPLRLSLQRFVLATRLDDVLVAASERLARMSKGRYRLQRNTTAEDRRSAGGLELEVEDNYTGRCRAVSTLSGGESFQAAMSLALGLSEVVQAYAGGIRLDTIFIDEGFGSLDSEALELAIDTLIDLQASGRLVGVISHVSELKERIDVRLQISTSSAGSSAAFRLP